MIDFPYSVAGFAVGAIVGLTGVGGGSLMTPLLALGLRTRLLKWVVRHSLVAVLLLAGTKLVATGGSPLGDRI